MSIFFSLTGQTLGMTVLVFIIGALGYMALELLWRRRTHWTMGLAGGICAAALFRLYSAAELPLWAAYIAGAAIITAVEFAFGYVCNIRLKMGVWDYSAVRFNLMGQICLPFSLIWGALGVAVWAAVRYGLGGAGGV